MKIKGLKRRVTIGFLSIATLLFLSGMLSFFELNTLSDDTDLILRANKRNMEFSRSMLHSLQLQNYAFVQIIAFGDRSLDSLCLSSVNELEQTIITAKAESAEDESMTMLLDSMILSVGELRGVSEQIVNMPTSDSTLLSIISLDALFVQNEREIYQDYQPIYNSMLNSIDQFLNTSQNIIAPRAESLHNNAYRAVTPVFISLVVMIIIVLLLYYFMLLYCVNPVVSMNRSLVDYLSYKIPFAPKGECRDEMLALKENIEVMIKQSKKTK